MGTTSSVTSLPKLHLFDLPPPLLVSVIECLPFRDIVGLVDFIMLSNKTGRRIWHAHIKRLLRCPDMDNRFYKKMSLRWVIEKEITIRNFNTMELEKGYTELHYACRYDEAWLVRACIAFNDADINSLTDQFGFTPLHLACSYAHINVVKLLLESGAESSLYRESRHGSIPITSAINNKRIDQRIDTTKLLISHHEKDNELENLGDAFRTAARNNLEIIKLILEVTGPDIIHSSFSWNGNTALHMSCDGFSDNTEVTEFLLALGAKVNAVDDERKTPLFNAAFSGHIECAKVLLAAGAYVNQVDSDGNTPLDIALVDDEYKSADSELAEMLKAAGGLRASQLPDDNDDNDDDDDVDDNDDGEI